MLEDSPRVFFYANIITEGINMAEETTSSSAIWAVAMIIIVALVVGGIYYIVRMGGPAQTPKKVDIDVSVPAR